MKEKRKRRKRRNRRNKETKGNAKKEEKQKINTTTRFPPVKHILSSLPVRIWVSFILIFMYVLFFNMLFSNLRRFPFYFHVRFIF